MRSAISCRLQPRSASRATARASRISARASWSNGANSVRASGWSGGRGKRAANCREERAGSGGARARGRAGGSSAAWSSCWSGRIYWCDDVPAGRLPRPLAGRPCRHDRAWRSWPCVLRQTRAGPGSVSVDRRPLEEKLRPLALYETGGTSFVEREQNDVERAVCRVGQRLDHGVAKSPCVSGVHVPRVIDDEHVDVARVRRVTGRAKEVHGRDAMKTGTRGGESVPRVSRPRTHRHRDGVRS